MASFAWSSKFREGQWRIFRRFMLEEKRDCSSRFEVLDRERERIGEVTMHWKIEDGYATELRIGFEVGPPGSSLEKLIKAYVALGGNPFDISMFLHPIESGGITRSDDPGSEALHIGDGSSQPGRGVLTPNDISMSFDQGVTDRDTNMLGFRPSREGGLGVKDTEERVATQVLHARKFISKEIRYKRWRLEEQIVKLCDLREQLDQEAQDMLWATYGDMLNSDNVYGTGKFNDSMTASNIAYFFDSTFRIPNAADSTGVAVNYDDSAEEGEAGSPNIDALGGYVTLVSDDPDEINSALR